VTETADLLDEGDCVGVGVGLGAVLELLHPLATPATNSAAPIAASRFMSFARLFDSSVAQSRITWMASYYM